MTKPTECALKGLLGADSTISPEQAKQVLDLLNGKPPQATILPTDEPDMVLSREAVASLIGKSVKSVDVYGRHGIFRRVYLTKGRSVRRQAQGYSRRSVLDAIRNGSVASDIR